MIQVGISYAALNKQPTSFHQVTGWFCLLSTDCCEWTQRWLLQMSSFCLHVGVTSLFISLSDFLVASNKFSNSCLIYALKEKTFVFQLGLELLTVVREIWAWW